jgi:hypothetical protein
MGSHPRRTAPHICTTKIILFSTKSKSSFAIINKLFHDKTTFFDICTPCLWYVGSTAAENPDFSHQNQQVMPKA